jgi:hypothetical protein
MELILCIRVMLTVICQPAPTIDVAWLRWNRAQVVENHLSERRKTSRDVLKTAFALTKCCRSGDCTVPRGKGAREPATPDLRDEKATLREAHSSDASPD